MKKKKKSKQIIWNLQ